MPLLRTTPPLNVFRPESATVPLMNTVKAPVPPMTPPTLRMVPPAGLSLPPDPPRVKLRLEPSASVAVEIIMLPLLRFRVPPEAPRFPVGTDGNLAGIDRQPAAEGIRPTQRERAAAGLAEGTRAIDDPADDQIFYPDAPSLIGSQPDLHPRLEGDGTRAAAHAAGHQVRLFAIFYCIVPAQRRSQQDCAPSFNAHGTTPD